VLNAALEMFLDLSEDPQVLFTQVSALPSQFIQVWASDRNRVKLLLKLTRGREGVQQFTKSLLLEQI